MSEQNNSNPSEQQDYPAFEFNKPLEGPLKSDKRGPLQSDDEKKDKQDALGSIIWALILVWAGLVFLASNFGWLEKIKFSSFLPEGLAFIGLGTWSLIFLGAGVLIFIEALIYTFAPNIAGDKNGNFFLAAIFMGIGLSGIIGWDLIWPFVLIFLGISALASALIRRNR